MSDERERIARIIDPWAFERIGNVLLAEAFGSRPAARERAYAKADDVIALRTPKGEGAEAVGRYITFNPSSEEGNAVISPDAPAEGVYWTLIGSGPNLDQNALAADIVARLNAGAEAPSVVTREWLIEIIKQHAFAADAADMILAALSPQGLGALRASPSVPTEGHEAAVVGFRALREALEDRLTDAKINCDGSGEGVAYAQGVIDTYEYCREALKATAPSPTAGDAK